MNEVYGFKKNIFCYLLAGMLLLAMAFLFSVLWMYVQLDQTRHQNWEQSIAKIFQQRIKEDTKNLEALLCVLGENPLLQQQFLAKNRAALLTLTRELNQRFQRDYQITHFYLHNLDQVNFLRIHQPERFGDLIERVTLQQAAETGKMAAGVELGPLGTLTIRVVMPWYDGKNRIGYLELGRELSTLLPSLSHLDLVDGYQLTVNKQYLNRKGWERGMAMLQRPADWDCFSDRVVMVNQLPKGVDPHNLESLGHGGLVDMLRPGETSYMSLSLPLLDALGRQVGQLSVIQNEAEEQQVTIKHICLTMLVLLGLTMLLLILFYRILSRVERRLTHSAEILKESREQLALALEAANLGLWDWRPQSDELYTNDIFLTMLGYAPDAFPQTTERWASLVHPDDFEPTLAILQRRIDGDDAYYHSEHRLRTADGQWKWILDVGRVVTRNTEGKAERFIGVHIDISERRQMEEVRLETNLLKEQLKRFESLKTMAGAIAHRFNNSMQAVVGNLEFLDMTIAAGSPGRESVSAALKVAREASRIGSMMLAYDGHRPLKLGSSNLTDLVKDSIAELKTRFIPSICLKFTPPSEPFYCSMDSPQIKEVINCVLTNAIESLEDETGTIEITFGTEKYEMNSFPLSFQNTDSKNGRYSFCQISDNGSGINKEDLTRIFEPFFTTKFVGRGLGLAMTVGIMRAHRGALVIKSIPDQGTTVRILLPALTETVAKNQTTC